MPFIRIWRYRAAPGRERDFEAAYGPDGPWAKLFRLGEGYLGTELLAPLPPSAHYLTIDRWRTSEEWIRFLEDHLDAYRSLDRELAPLCAQDEELGNYDADPPVAGHRRDTPSRGCGP